MILCRLVCLPLLLGAALTFTAPAASALQVAPAQIRATIPDDQPNPLQPVICAIKADAEGCKKAEPPK